MSANQLDLLLSAAGATLPRPQPLAPSRNKALAAAEAIARTIESMPLGEAVDLLNQVRSILHSVSPFKSEPVDFVSWVKNDTVAANDYNPNSVAPPEMELLSLSILADGYTQPIVTMPTGNKREVVDGFHRSRVGKENEAVCSRVCSYLPVVSINQSRTDKGDRIAATIRHNRARGKHAVTAMSDIVVELKKRNWSDERVAKELGMDADEVLRLTQVSGLAELFSDQDFSLAWESGEPPGIGDELLTDVPDGEVKRSPGRILHTWEKWECYSHGFYELRPANGLTIEEGENLYREFLSNIEAFDSSLRVVTTEWRHSCEHYLTNDRMNRIAWLGQAAAAQAIGMPSCCRGGYHLLSEEQKQDADALALLYLNSWLEANDRPAITMPEALGRTEAELY